MHEQEPSGSEAASVSRAEFDQMRSRVETLERDLQTMQETLATVMGKLAQVRGDVAQRALSTPTPQSIPAQEDVPKQSMPTVCDNIRRVLQTIPRNGRSQAGTVEAKDSTLI